MTVDDLTTHLATNWETIEVALLTDGYYPQAIRRVMIPKPSSGEPHLGIPTVLNPVVRGWAVYFSLSETKQLMEPLDSWLRHRLRKVRWQQ